MLICIVAIISAILFNSDYNFTNIFFIVSYRVQGIYLDETFFDNSKLSSLWYYYLH